VNMHKYINSAREYT